MLHCQPLLPTSRIASGSCLGHARRIQGCLIHCKLRSSGVNSCFRQYTLHFMCTRKTCSNTKMIARATITLSACTLCSQARLADSVQVCRIYQLFWQEHIIKCCFYVWNWPTPLKSARQGGEANDSWAKQHTARSTKVGEERCHKRTKDIRPPTLKAARQMSPYSLSYRLRLSQLFARQPHLKARKQLKSD